MNITTRVCEIVAAHVEPQLRHLVTEDAAFEDLHLAMDHAAFEDLHLAMDHAWSIASDWELENGYELDWRKVEAWQSVADIISTVEHRGRIVV